MCGICGILSSRPRQLDLLFRMNHIQAHRGPDGQGHLFLGNNGPNLFRDSRSVKSANETYGTLALGHRRLSILDCSDAGLQPMADTSCSNWIVYNGEIYNYLELRSELKEKGHRFQSTTDTEVILAAYKQWGTHCFQHFNGMWALAIWDSIHRRLILSRDRFGIKPLHYIKVGQCLIFASEIKALLLAPDISRQLNIDNAISYLKWGLVNQNHTTFFNDILSFPSGHYAEIDPDRPSDWTPSSYWKLKAPELHDSVSLESASETFKELLHSAVNIRMRSDVPVGSCLSGGLDSSSIVCMMSLHAIRSNASLSTFTAGTNDPKTDETPWAKYIAKHVKASVSVVYPRQEGFLCDLEKLIWHQEEPFTTASIYAQWLVMQSAREARVPVLLDGQGADETLCGYRKFMIFHLQELLFKLKLGRIVKEMIALMRHGDRGIFNWRQGKRYLPKFIRDSIVKNYFVIKPEFLMNWNTNHVSIGSRRTIAARQVEDLMRFSVPSLLRYEDRNSMAWSIESRVPFLDYRLVEFLVNLPVEAKLNEGKTKAILRSAMKGIVPQNILKRRDKVGFVAPQEIWMKGHLGRVVSSELGSSEFKLSRMIQCGHLLKRFQSSPDTASTIQETLFRLFILNRWMQLFNVQLN